MTWKSAKNAAAGNRIHFFRPLALATATTVLVASLATGIGAKGPARAPRVKAKVVHMDTRPAGKDTICVESAMGENCYPAKTTKETRIVRVGDMLPQAQAVGICKDQGFWVTKVDGAGIDVVYSTRQLVDVQPDRIRIRFGKPRVVGEYLLRAKITAKKGRAKGTAIVTVASSVVEAAVPSDAATKAALRSLDTMSSDDFTAARDTSADTNANR